MKQPSFSLGPKAFPKQQKNSSLSYLLTNAFLSNDKIKKKFLPLFYSLLFLSSFSFIFNIFLLSLCIFVEGRLCTQTMSIPQCLLSSSSLAMGVCVCVCVGLRVCERERKCVHVYEGKLNSFRGLFN